MPGRWFLFTARFPRLTALVTSLLIHGVAAAACFVSLVWWLTGDETPVFGFRQGPTMIELAYIPPEEEAEPVPVQILPNPQAEDSKELPLETKPLPRSRGIDAPALDLPSMAAAGQVTEAPPKILVALPPLTQVAKTAPEQNSAVKRGERQKQRAGQNAALSSQGANEYVDAGLDVVPPIYPDAMLRRKVGGTVLLELQIAASGAVTRVGIVRSSGYPLFDAAAINAASKWRGIPAQRAGMPVETIVMQEVIFKAPR